jgi:hypothetical protein
MHVNVRGERGGNGFEARFWVARKLNVSQPATGYTQQFIRHIFLPYSRIDLAPPRVFSQQFLVRDIV